MAERSPRVIAFRLVVSILMALIGGYLAIRAYFLSGQVDDYQYVFVLGLAIIGIVLLVLGLKGTRANLQRFAAARHWSLAWRRFALLALLALMVMYFILAASGPSTAGQVRMQYWAGRRDFREVSLEGANLSGANLQGVDLEGANLQGADLGNANLHDAYLVDADLRRANLIGADLRKAWLKTGKLDSTTQIDEKWHLVWSIQQEGGSNRGLRGADLSDANLWGADLSGADLRGANLRGAWLAADLTGADLSGADLTDATVGVSNLCGVNLRGANLTGTWLEGVDLTKEIMPGCSLHE